VFGSSNPYAQPGETQLTISSRNLRSTDHYNRDVEQLQRQTLGSYVLNTQHAFDFNVTHVFTERFSMSVGVPYIAASWGIPSPTTAGPSARANQQAHGIGDISVSGRTWIFPTNRFRAGNIAVGAGIKAPTGNSEATDVFPNINGTNPKEKPVDQSVQPGDGGWGVTFELQGFRRIPHGQLFGTFSYLANPRDHNDTTSIGYNISAAAVPPINPDGTSYNSVPDQYLARLGGAFPLGKTGFVGSMSWHVEGLPRYDVFGDSHGFRRPGVEMFIEPGLSYAKGSHIYNFSVPIAYYRNRFPNPNTGNAGDATFPNYIFLASYSWRFGGRNGTSDAALCQ
jgi:hypothetical protein